VIVPHNFIGVVTTALFLIKEQGIFNKKQFPGTVDNRNEILMKFRIEQYEIWVQPYLVEAESLAKAIKKVQEGDVGPQEEDGDMVIVGPADDIGISVEQLDQQEKESLTELMWNDGVISSIAGWKEVKDEDDDLS
jgi:hypothetical protein